MWKVLVRKGVDSRRVRRPWKWRINRRISHRNYVVAQGVKSCFDIAWHNHNLDALQSSKKKGWEKGPVQSDLLLKALPHVCLSHKKVKGRKEEDSMCMGMAICENPPILSANLIWARPRPTICTMTCQCNLNLTC